MFLSQFISKINFHMIKIYLKVFIALTAMVLTYYYFLAPVMGRITGRSTHLIIRNDETFPIKFRIKSFYIFSRSKLIYPNQTDELIIYPGVNRAMNFQILDDKGTKVLKEITLPIFPHHACFVWSNPQALRTWALSRNFFQSKEMEDFLATLSSSSPETQAKAQELMSKMLIKVDAKDVIFGFDSDLSLLYPIEKIPKAITKLWEKHPLVFPPQGGKWENSQHQIIYTGDTLTWYLILHNEKLIFTKTNLSEK